MPLAGVEADGSVVVRAGVGAVCCGGVWSVMAVGVDAATEDAGGSGADTGVGRADGAWHGRTAPLAWGEPEGVTPAGGHERGNRTADGDVEAAVDAAVNASVDADVGADVDASCNSGVGAGVNAGVGADAGSAGVGAVVGGLLV